MARVLNCSGYETVKEDMALAGGCFLFDEAGQQYLDLEAGVWCLPLGHNHPRINGAVRHQMARVAHTGFRFTTAVVDTAAQSLLGTLAMPDGCCVFLSSGSEAVEFSLQAARCIAEKPGFLTLSDTYLAAYGLGGKGRGDDWACLDWAPCTRCLLPDCDPGCGRLALIPFDRLGAFVFEPGSTSGLVRFPPKPLVQALARSVRDRGGLVVVDEVTTGLGRTGAWYGFNHYGLAPDLVALGKGLGNGYPVSAVAMAAGARDRLAGTGFRYGQSHLNDPLGCAVAREVIAVIKEERLVERSRKTGARFLAGLEAVGLDHASVRHVRGRGLMLAVELAPGMAMAVGKALLRKGIMAGCKPEADLIRFYPPLVLEAQDVDRVVENLARVLDGIGPGKTVR